MKLLKQILCIGLLLSLSSCQSNVVKYTSEDASEYSLEETKTSKAEMIGVKTVNKDTIWTFQESFDRGLKWQVFDRHVLDSTSVNETNFLSNNYTVIVLDYYLALNVQINELFDISYTYLDGYKSSIVFSSEYDSRDTLKTKYDQFITFMDYVKEENAKYSDKSVDYDVLLEFKNHDHYIYTSDDLTFSDLDNDNLNYACEYNVNDLLTDYTKDEIDQWKQEHEDTRIYLRDTEDDTWLPSDFYAVEDHLGMSSTVLYDLLSIGEYKDITLEGTRDDFKVKTEKKEYGPYSYAVVPFIEAEQITNIRFQIKNNIKDDDTLSTKD